MNLFRERLPGWFPVCRWPALAAVRFGGAIALEADDMTTKATSILCSMLLLMATLTVFAVRPVLFGPLLAAFAAGLWFGKMAGKKQAEAERKS